MYKQDLAHEYFWTLLQDGGKVGIERVADEFARAAKAAITPVTLGEPPDEETLSYVFHPLHPFEVNSFLPEMYKDGWQPVDGTFYNGVARINNAGHTAWNQANADMKLEELPGRYAHKIRYFKPWGDEGELGAMDGRGGVQAHCGRGGEAGRGCGVAKVFPLGAATDLAKLAVKQNEAHVGSKLDHGVTSGSRTRAGAQRSTRKAKEAEKPHGGVCVYTPPGTDPLIVRVERKYAEA